LATLYNLKKQHQEALNYYRQCLTICRELENKGLISNALAGIASTYELLGDDRQALAHYNESLAMEEQLGRKYQMSMCLANLAQIHAKQHQFNTSKKYAQRAYALARETNNLNLLLHSTRAFVSADSGLGHWKSAFEYNKLYSKYLDSLHAGEKAKQLGRLEAKYEYEKEQQSQLQAQQRLRISYTFAGIAIMVLMFSAFFFYRYQAKSRINRLLKDANYELATKNDELAAQADQIAQQRDELDKAYRKIEQAFRKLKELDEFKEALSGMIVHDLKNPLSAIIGISNKPLITNTDRIAIRQAGKQMLNLTLNILDVQKFEQASVPLHLKDEALLTIVHDAVEQVSLLIANKNLQLSLTILPDTGVFCDVELITRVLMNLLTNAIKYTPNNGSISIRAEENPDNQVKISVSDTGQGIPADKLDTVFDKFSQVEAKKSGGARSTGLGLTFCKMTVEAHGGQIGVTSQVGVGTTFYFTLSKAINQVKAAQPFILPTNTVTEINLTAEDQALLQPFLEKLRALDVYEAGEVLKIIAPIPDTPALAAWKSEMERTVFASNQERFVELVISNDAGLNESFLIRN
jgi:signal transduction histidine kinase